MAMIEVKPKQLDPILGCGRKACFCDKCKEAREATRVARALAPPSWVEAFQEAEKKRVTWG